MDLFVVHNPLAGDGSWTRLRLERLLRDAGHSPRIVDAKADWPHRMDGVSTDAFVAVGGDGTFQRLAASVAGRPEPVAILATGTANNVARALDVEKADLAECVAHWGERESAFHLAEARVGVRSRPFVEVAGTGAFARVLGNKPRVPVDAPAAEKLHRGRLRLAEEVLTMDPFRARLSVDDAAPTDDDFLLVACLNLPAFGPRLALAPAESASTGMISVCAVRADQRPAFADWVVGPEADPAPWFLARGRAVALTTPARKHVDDRLWPGPRAPDLMEMHGRANTIRVWA